MKHKKRRCVYLAITLLLCAAGALLRQNAHLQENYASEVVRFHVLANSNTQEDQALKICVRNKVGAYVSELLQNARTKKETLQIMERHLPQIERAAQEEVAKQGFAYEVRADLEETDFPVKVYGKYHMPKGRYTSLQIKIGEAKGQNWWCVLYPNMCFAGSTYEIVEKEEKEQMYRVFTLYEYKKLIENPNKEIRFRYFTNRGE